MLQSSTILLGSLLSIMAVSTVVRGDEGMWLFNALPLKHLEQNHQFSPTTEWADHLRLSSVRFNSGGSGSFVSSDGLVLTNHHVASDTLHKLSTPERNIIDAGFLAKQPSEELPAPDLELNQLVSIENVTERVNAAVAADLNSDEASKARRAIISTIEKESLDSTGLRSDVVTLYGGAQYHLYRYKKYTDVRLVWAPETKAAFFGGDADNFEYPRYCLDASLMRVYEDGKPAKIDNHLGWSDQPVANGDLVFVSGNPGRTQRIFTTAAFKFLRDERLPYVLDFLRRKEIMLQQYGLEGIEQKRQARDELFGIQNARKAYTGMLAGLQSPQTIQTKQAAEDQLLSAAAKDEGLKPLTSAWQQIADIQIEKAKLLGQSTGFQSRLYDIAETLVLMSAEDQKPNSERLREYGEAGRESLLQDLLSEAPIYPDLERAKLADELARFVEQRGGDDPLVQHVLNGQSPQERASELIAGTKLADVAARQTLVDGDRTHVLASDDALISLALLMEPEYRAHRTRREELEEQERQAYTKVSEVTAAIDGTDTYPDATFTLRLAFGTVKGYQENGQTVQPWTVLNGAFEHAAEHEGQEDFDLPESWLAAKEKIDGHTQLNFICTADIIGGNSGSPVVNREGDLVGLIFDGNIQSLTSDYLYSDEQARAVSVSAAAIREVIRNVYQAPELADSLGK
ncbi:Peptidase S46 [Roseimaritima multifibrata]|uniref:Dipeptidyl-peptidase n=1 Tax=Roseimaritima multifibrata TaxID=1930274 RepID=A0A517MKK1_9BACT|nr:Peptidase S46 [Roseimaritima multifibrata]